MTEDDMAADDGGMTGDGGAVGDGDGAVGDGDGGNPGDDRDAGGTCAGHTDARAANEEPDPTRVERILQPAEWTSTSLFALPPTTLEMTKPQGAATDTVRLAFEQERPDNNDSAYEFFGEATAVSDRVVRFSWAYTGQRSLKGTDPVEFLQLYADGPSGRTAVNVYEGVAVEVYARSGTATLTLHAGYTFGIRLVDRSMVTISGSITLTTLESRPLDEVVPPTPEPARPPCSSDEPNQAPTLALEPGFHFDTDPQPYVALRWAKLAAGPSSEAYQRLTAELSVTATTGTLTFDAPPTMDPATGALFFAITPGTYGTATVLVAISDDGGTANGGADTTSGSFTIRVNTPPAALRDTQFRHPWKALGIPFILGTDDVDPYEIVAIEFLSHPTEGYLDGTYFTLNGHGWVETNGTSPPLGAYAHSFLYIPISSTFTGLDSLTYRMHDHHGGVTEPASVTLEIFEN